MHHFKPVWVLCGFCGEESEVKFGPDKDPCCPHCRGYNNFEEID